MKKKYLLGLGAMIGLGLVMATQEASASSVALYRLYNPNSGEHFYTENSGEKDSLVKAGWNDEGIGWQAPTTGDAVYRLYNANAGDHHYTLNKGEYDHLVSLGWKGEGESFYSADQSVERREPVFRAYNPNAKTGTHNFTINEGEQRDIVRLGWKDEGTAFYAVSETAGVNKADLQERVEAGQKLETANYSADSVKAFQAELKKAEAVLADGNATQEQVDAAKKALNQSFDNLVNLLEAKIRLNKVDALKAADYGNRSFATFLKTPELVKLRELVADPAVTKDQLNKAIDAYGPAVKAAYDKVVYVGYLKALMAAKYDAADFKAGMEGMYPTSQALLQKTLEGANDSTYAQAQVDEIVEIFVTKTLPDTLNENGLKKVPAKTDKPVLYTSEDGIPE